MYKESMLLCPGHLKMFLVFYMFDQTQVGETVKAISTPRPLGGRKVNK